MRPLPDDVYVPPEACLVTLRFVVDAPLSPPSDLRFRALRRPKTLRGLALPAEAERHLDVVTRPHS